MSTLSTHRSSRSASSTSPSSSATATSSADNSSMNTDFGFTSFSAPPLPTGTRAPATAGLAASAAAACPAVYTFLATLILLLGVSSAIVVRSLLLRRRHAHMVAEAIANGTWVLRRVSRAAGGWCWSGGEDEWG
ncbi:hypothetical protein B0H17DRAFT_1217615 [Mycena rosella]|uniref:Uncharacterized protein n=1 Tax=Mycena rosella TaxID=1033263 RepID=A0AAD7FM71_MYCRO|nr:hypothetical protein B0H17DRAFT_1217615 [Mycena rosella]